MTNFKEEWNSSIANDKSIQKKPILISKQKGYSEISQTLIIKKPFSLNV